MKIINLNESQYQRLFEMSPTVAGLGDNNPSEIPPVSSGQIYVDGPTTKSDGTVDNVPDNDKAGVNLKNKLDGSERVAGDLTMQYPCPMKGRVGAY